MNRKQVSKAISNIDEAFIVEAMSPPAVTACAPERTQTMNHNKKRTVSSRKIFRLVLAACLIFALAVTAFAFNFLGIRDMLARTGRELPDEAEGYIRQHVEAAGAEDWGARILESLSDDSKLMVTVQVSGGDKYILAPTDADPDTLAVNIGVEGDLTLGEYAKQQGKKLLFVGASLQETGGSGGHGSQHFEHSGDGEMTILVQADAWNTNENVICCVYAVDENWKKTKLDIPVQFSKAPSGETGTYVPVDADAVAGVTVGNATVTETPLGITVRYMETITDEAAYGNIKRVEFEGLAYGEGGTMLEDGNWYLTVSGCIGSVGDTLTVQFYDWDDQSLGQIVFEKSE